MSDHQDATDTPDNQDGSEPHEGAGSTDNPSPNTHDSDDAEREQDRQLETGEENPT